MAGVDLMESKFDPNILSYKSVGTDDAPLLRKYIQKRLPEVGVLTGAQLVRALQDSRNMFRIHDEFCDVGNNQKRKRGHFAEILAHRIYIHLSVKMKKLVLLIPSLKLTLDFCWKINCSGGASINEELLCTKCIRWLAKPGGHRIQLNSAFQTTLGENFEFSHLREQNDWTQFLEEHIKNSTGGNEETLKNHLREMVTRNAIFHCLHTCLPALQTSRLSLSNLDKYQLSWLETRLETSIFHYNSSDGVAKVSFSPILRAILVKFPDEDDWRQKCIRADCYGWALSGSLFCREHWTESGVERYQKALALEEEFRQCLLELGQISLPSEMTTDIMQKICQKVTLNQGQKLPSGNVLYKAQNRDGLILKTKEKSSRLTCVNIGIKPGCTWVTIPTRKQCLYCRDSCSTWFLALVRIVALDETKWYSCLRLEEKISNMHSKHVQQIISDNTKTLRNAGLVNEDLKVEVIREFKLEDASIEVANSVRLAMILYLLLDSSYRNKVVNIFNSSVPVKVGSFLMSRIQWLLNITGLELVKVENPVLPLIDDQHKWFTIIGPEHELNNPTGTPADRARIRRQFGELGSVYQNYNLNPVYPNDYVGANHERTGLGRIRDKPSAVYHETENEKSFSRFVRKDNQYRERTLLYASNEALAGVLSCESLVMVGILFGRQFNRKKMRYWGNQCLENVLVNEHTSSFRYRSHHYIQHLQWFMTEYFGSTIEVKRKKGCKYEPFVKEY